MLGKYGYIDEEIKEELFHMICADADIVDVRMVNWAQGIALTMLADNVRTRRGPSRNFFVVFEQVKLFRVDVSDEARGEPRWWICCDPKIRKVKGGIEISIGARARRPGGPWYESSPRLTVVCESYRIEEVNRGVVRKLERLSDDVRQAGVFQESVSMCSMQAGIKRRRRAKTSEGKRRGRSS